MNIYHFTGNSLVTMPQSIALGQLTQFGIVSLEATIIRGHHVVSKGKLHNAQINLAANNASHQGFRKCGQSA